MEELDETGTDYEVRLSCLSKAVMHSEQEHSELKEQLMHALPLYEKTAPALVEARSQIRLMRGELRGKTERLTCLSTRSTEIDECTQLSEERLNTEVTIEQHKDQRGDGERGESVIGILESVARLKVKLKQAASVLRVVEERGRWSVALLDYHKRIRKKTMLPMELLVPVA